MENETKNSIDEVTTTSICTGDEHLSNSVDHDNKTEEEEDQDILKFE